MLRFSSPSACRGLSEVLTTRSLTSYPKVCAQATAEFSVLSDTIKSIQKVILSKDCQRALVSLQEAEKTKLNLTAALHLERIRRQSEEDDKICDLLNDSIRSLESKIATAVETINENIDEIRIHLMDL